MLVSQAFRDFYRFHLERAEKLIKSNGSFRYMYTKFERDVEASNFFPADLVPRKLCEIM